MEEVISKPEVKKQTSFGLEQQVTVHCKASTESLYRVWKSTYLICKQSGKRSKIMHALDITWNPKWCLKQEGQSFTLIFEALPKGCTSFDLIEDIPQSDPFCCFNIPRNKRDVYRVVM
jgi:hypothetical protein